MKTFATCFLLIGAVLAVAYAYPASSESKSDPADDAEFIVVPPEHQRPSYYNRYPSSFDSFDGVVDTGDFPHPGQSPVFFPSVNPFTWQFSSYLDDLIKRLRDRMAGSWNPFYGGSDFAHSGPGVWPIEIPDDDSSEDAQTNTTSTVKFIDGHKVIINDTYYTKKTGYGTSIYKVRVIDVKPAEEGESEKPATEEKPVETGNRNGSDDDEAPKKEDDNGSDADQPAKKDEAGETDTREPTTTAAPRRDTELDSSDEEATPIDDSVNSVDSDTDIDAGGWR
uniref:Putative virus-induced protein n=1 Tax=Ochlerotatus triseriatus TaxID=7162 RepID=C6ZR00_OCHTR